MILSILLAASMRMNGDALLRNIGRIAPDATTTVTATSAPMRIESSPFLW